jgi:hypothetical protein
LGDNSKRTGRFEMKNKKNVILLVATIFGALVLMFIFSSLAVRTDGTGSDSLAKIAWAGIPNGISTISEICFAGLPFAKIVIMIGFIILLILLIIYLAIFPIVSIIAVVLNCIGWKSNNKKIILASAVLYVVGLNIISAALCFIVYAKLKKMPVDQDIIGASK